MKVFTNLGLLVEALWREKNYSEPAFPDIGARALVMDLSTMRVWGSAEPNVLGINDFDHRYLFVLEGLLRDHSGEQIKASVGREYPADQAGKLKGEVEGIASTLRLSLLLLGQSMNRQANLSNRLCLRFFPQNDRGNHNLVQRQRGGYGVRGDDEQQAAMFSYILSGGKP